MRKRGPMESVKCNLILVCRLTCVLDLANTKCVRSLYPNTFAADKTIFLYVPYDNSSRNFAWCLKMI